MIFNTGESEMTKVEKAQKKYDEALEKYNKSNTTKNWNELEKAQEKLNEEITEMMKGL